MHIGARFQLDTQRLWSIIRKRHTVGQRREPKRERWPEDLPVIEKIIKPQEVQATTEDWWFIGAEVGEQLDYEPARFLLRRQDGRENGSLFGKSEGPCFCFAVMGDRDFVIAQESTR